METGVVLRGLLISLASKRGRAFVIDCTDAAEGRVSDDHIRAKYGLAIKDLQDCAKNQALGRAIKAEHDRCINIAAQEAATRHSVKTP